MLSSAQMRTQKNKRTSDAMICGWIATLKSYHGFQNGFFIISSYLAYSTSPTHTSLCLPATTPGLMLLSEGQNAAHARARLCVPAKFCSLSKPNQGLRDGFPLLAIELPVRSHQRCGERFEQWTGDRCHGLFSPYATWSTLQYIWTLKRRKCRDRTNFNF